VPRIVVILMLLLVSAFLVRIGTVLCISPPRNLSDASLAGFKGIILNDHPLVIEKLRQITKSFDQRNFADNLVAVYYYVKSLPYYYDRDVWGTEEFWATGPETIQKRGGDCEDHAILLATLIEVLYGETFGRDKIPQNLVWIVMGNVKTSEGSGGHAWAVINLNALSSDASSRIRSIPPFRTKVEAVIGDIISYKGETIKEVWVTFDLAKLAPKQKPLALSVFWLGDEYVELESTWGSAISEYFDKAYPYTEVWVAFNSLQYVNSPQFIPSGRPLVGSVAVIRNVAFNREIKVNEASPIRVTVQNFGRGIVGADFVLIMKSGVREIARDSAYILKYIWTIHNFFFNLVSTSSGTKILKLELYWNNRGSLQLEDDTEFSITVVAGTVPTISTSATTQLVTYRFFSLPEDCEREQPSSYENRDLGKIIRIEGVGSYRTPFSLQLTPRVTYVFSCSGAIAWDYYGIGPKEGETVQYTLNELNTEIAAYFASRLTYRFFSLPDDCRGQRPSNNADKDLGKVITVEGVGSYRTPFSVQLTPGRSYTFTCSGAVSWDYYTIGWKNGQTVQYTLDHEFNEIAAFFASPATQTTTYVRTSPTTQVISTDTALTGRTMTLETQVVSATTSGRYVLMLWIMGSRTETMWTISTIGEPGFQASGQFSASLFVCLVIILIACLVAIVRRHTSCSFARREHFSPVQTRREGPTFNTINCHHCGATIPYDSVFCAFCGDRARSPAGSFKKPEVSPAAKEEKEIPKSIPIGVMLTLDKMDKKVYDYILEHEGTVSLSQAAKDLGISLDELRAAIDRLISQRRLL